MTSAQTTDDHDPAGSEELGLRELKKRQTRMAMHRAALELVVEHGLSAVTAQMIAERAGVSTRTFFNYFTSKDEAVFGFRSPHLPDEALAAVDPAGDPVTEASRLLLATMRTATPHGTAARRRRLQQQNPSLGRYRMQALAEAEDLVIEALTTTFADHPALAQAADGPQDTVRMWCTIAGAVLRHAATAPDRTPGAALTDADLQSSLALFHDLHGSTA